jgi:uncharacterized integral membrane protein (TIGR00697 family)
VTTNSLRRLRTLFRSLPIYALLMSFSATLLVVSNILATKPIAFGPIWFMPFNDGMIILDAAFITYIFVWAIGDLLGYVYGRLYAGVAIVAGFAAMFIMNAAMQFGIILPASADYQGQAALETVFDFSMRVAAASLIAYLLGAFINLYVLARLKRKFQDRRRWQQFMGSSVFGHVTDTTFFGVFAFAGMFDRPTMVNFIVTGVLYKLAVEALLSPFTVWSAGRIERFERERGGCPDIKMDDDRQDGQQPLKGGKMVIDRL